MSKIKTLLTYVLLLLLVGGSIIVGISLTRDQSPDDSSAAVSAPLNLELVSPASTIGITVGAEIKIAVKSTLPTTGDTPSGAEIILDYDPTIFQVKTITEGSGSLGLNKKSNDTNGFLTIDVAKIGQKGYKGPTVLTEVVLTVKKITQTTQIKLNQSSTFGVPNSLDYANSVKTLNIQMQTLAQGVCGDGQIQTPNGNGVNEVCDDGNTVNNDQCSNDCKNKCTAPQVWNGSACISPAVCGNGTKETGEVCDDGNTANNDQCSNDCKNSCPSGQKWTGTKCETIVTAVCGNGTKETGEICDDGNTTNGDRCSADCKNSCPVDQIWNGTQCTTTTPPQVCGNGTQESGEVCDDGNTVNNDQCSNDCKNKCTAPQVWNGTSCVNPVTNPVCGNNTQETGEVCDDGNTSNNDQCSNDCKNKCTAPQIWNGTSCVNPAGDDTVTCGPLDVNNNNKFDITDLAAFLKVYNKTCSDTAPSNGCKGKNTNPSVDNKITVIDLANVLNRYNKDSCLL